MPTYNIALLILTSIIIIFAITTYIPFKLNFVLTFDFIFNITVISISQTNKMYLFIFFCFNPVTKTLRGVLKICYCNNIKTWMKNCACWNYDILLQWFLFPIPIIIFLHGAKILFLNNLFACRNIFSVNCCIIFQSVYL